ncbi:Kelch-like protein 24 [Branchiostoma belcheri]|nr:Kelch-like protein 24 [Branchiostoma belcheri]
MAGVQVVPECTTCPETTQLSSPAQSDTSVDSDPTSNEKFTNTSHATNVLEGLQRLRSDHCLVDVVLCAGNREFPCHRAILSCCSGYFQAMFTNGLKETKQTKVVIKNMNPSILESILSYIYSSELVINKTNVQQLLEAANLMQLTPIVEACAKYLGKMLETGNCLGIHRFASALCCTELAEKAQDFVLEHFQEVCQMEEFSQLEASELARYMSDNRLNVSKEELVYEALLRWVQCDKKSRGPQLKDLLPQIRFPLMDPVSVVRNVRRNELVNKTEGFESLMEEATIYHLSPEEVSSTRTVHRERSGITQVLVVGGGVTHVENEEDVSTNHINCFDPKEQLWDNDLLDLAIDFRNSVEYAAVTLHNNIIVSGGSWKGSAVWELDTKLSTWRKLSSLAQRRSRHKMAVLNGKVYAVGGYDSSKDDGCKYLDSVEVYDPNRNEWMEGKQLLNPVSSFAIASCDGKLYVIGGKGQTGVCSPQVQCYVSDKNCWETRAPMPRKGECINAALLNSLIYVVGGKLPAILCYDPKADTWISLAERLTLWEFCGIAACNGKLYITGGSDREQRSTEEADQSLDTVQCYDPGTNTLTFSLPLPEAVNCHFSVTILKYKKT